jgi:KDO2-lipid IV(A) lauroyltransferase
MTTLKQGNVVGFVPDLRIDGGELIPFFGVDAPSNTTAARLALHHGCELLPVRAERLPNCRFRITVFRSIQPDDPNAPIDIQAKQMTRKQLALFESWIRDTPDQWLCVGRRWGEEAYAPQVEAMDVLSSLDLSG